MEISLKLQFSEIFSSMIEDISVIFGMWICHEKF